MAGKKMAEIRRAGGEGGGEAPAGNVAVCLAEIARDPPRVAAGRRERPYNFWWSFF